MRRFPGLLALVMLFTCSAEAGVVLKYRVKIHKIDAKVVKMAQGDSARYEVSRSGGSAMIYSGSRKFTASIDLNGKRFSGRKNVTPDNIGKYNSPVILNFIHEEQELFGRLKSEKDPKEAERIKERIRGLRKNVKRLELKRARVPQVKWKKKKGTEKVGKWRTERWVATRNGSLVTEVWVIPYKRLKFKRADLKGIEEFDRLLMAETEFPRKPNEQLGSEGLTLNAWQYGVIAKEKRAAGGVLELLEITRKDLSKDLFEVPPGYRGEFVDLGEGPPL